MQPKARGCQQPTENGVGTIAAGAHEHMIVGAVKVKQKTLSP